MRRIFWYLLSLCCLAASVTAQTPDATPAPKAAKAAKSKVDPLAKERRETALTIVNELADEARAFRDELLRARVQTRAADVIWDADPERARVLFRRAWDAADTADREALRQREEKARQAQANGGSFAYRSPPNLRNEVLQAATRRDRALGEELLARLDETRQSENSNASANTPPANDTDDPQNLPPALAQRLEAASALLETGEVERALQFAEPGLAAVTMPGLSFLVHLRQQNAAAADQRYAALLARAANAPNTNANTVSLLSSYIFTPGLFMVISPNGGLATYSTDRQPPVDAPELRLAFLNFAAQILMRPLPPLEQENAKGRRTGIYLVTSRLLPLFEQFAPEHIGVLRAQIAAVTADVSEETRDPRNPWLSRGLTPANEEGDESATALERAEKAKTPEQRDSLYAVAALSLVSKEPARAYDIADKISDSQLRQQLRSYLDFTSLGRALNQKNPTEALRVARKGDLTNIQRDWGLTEAAKLLSRQTGRKPSPFSKKRPWKRAVSVAQTPRG